LLLTARLSEIGDRFNVFVVEANDVTVAQSRVEIILAMQQMFRLTQHAFMQPHYIVQLVVDRQRSSQLFGVGDTMTSQSVSRLSTANLQSPNATYMQV